MPPLIGWAAARGSLEVGAWVLYAILFLWQFPHFLAIAWLYREDYSRAGYLMLPAGDQEGRRMAWQVVLCSLALIPISLMPTWLGQTGLIYFVGAFVLGLAFLNCGAHLAVTRSKALARRLLLASIVYLPLVFALMILDKTLA
jgi:protoheme IX farnesyltransferase